jgi:cell division protein ZapA (FtsZ GTPase activity inhibitor)
MAVDAQILKLLSEQDKRQSNYRQVSRDYMKNSSNAIDSINENVRYNITQSNSLKSGLGEITGRLLKEIKNNNLTNKISTTKLPQSDATKAPIIKRLDEIKDILQKQYELTDRYLNSQFESEPTKLIGDKEKEKEPEEKEKEDDKESKGSGLGALVGAALAAAMVPFIEPIGRVVSSLKAIAGRIPGIFKSIRSGMNKLWNSKFISNVRGKMNNLFKRIRTGTGNLFKNMRSGLNNFMSKARGRLGNVISSVRKGLSTVGTTIKNFGSSVKNATSAVGGFLKSMGGKAADLLKGAASKAGDLMKSAGSTLKNIAGKAGSFMKMLPGAKTVATIAKGAKGVVKRLPLISAAFEGADAAAIAAMSEKEREEYLDSIAKDMEGKSILGRAWYAFNNNSKTIAAAIGTFKDTQKLQQENQSAEARIAEMEAELKRRQEARKIEKKEALPIDQSESDKRLMEEFKKFNERFEDPEFWKTLPVDPATIINQTSVTVPGDDYGTYIRRNNK